MSFVENLEMTHIVGGGVGYVICVIMAHCVGKSICDSHLISQHFCNYGKYGASQLWSKQYHN